MKRIRISRTLRLCLGVLLLAALVLGGLAYQNWPRFSAVKRIRISRTLRLCLGVLLLAALVLGCLAYQNWPRFSVSAAYRRVIAENLRAETPLSLELEADVKDQVWAIGLTEDGTARQVMLRREELSWRAGAFATELGISSGSLAEFPTVEGLCCVPLYWKSLVDSTAVSKPSPETPVLALRAEPEAVRAEVTLRVEAFTPWPEYPTYSYPAGTLELVPLGQREGWFLFGFGLEGETLAQAADPDNWTAARSLTRWLTHWAAARVNTGANYEPPAQQGEIEVRLYDGNGGLIRAVRVTP